MKKYLLRIILVLIIVIPVTYIINKLIFKGINNYFQVAQKDVLILKKDTTNYDFLFLGSSRILTFVDPKIIDSILGVNSYNYARNGATFVENSMLLKSYLLKHNPPKNILLGADLFSFNPKVGFYPCYLTFLDVQPINDELCREGIRTSFYKTFPFLKTTLISDYDRGAYLKTLQHNVESNVIMYKGYSPNGIDTIKLAPGNKVILPRNDISMRIAKEGKKALFEIIDLCKQKNINLILTYSPEFDSLNIKKEGNAASKILSLYDSVASANNLPFLKNQNLPMCKERKYFVNAGHVNIPGAQLYSTILANQFLLLKEFKK